MRLSPAIAATVLTGCFFAPPINQRPSADIRQALPSGAVHRGDPVLLEAVGQDPDGDSVTFSWHVSACTDASDQNTDCDAPFRNDANPSAETTIMFDAPVMRADGVTAVKALRVVLDTTDELGATARPSQELAINLDDYAPVLTLHQDSRHDYVVDSHIQLFVEVTDQDDLAKNVPTTITVDTAPPGATYELTDLPTQGTTDPITYGKELLPHTKGMWEIRASGTDPFGVTTAQFFVLQVGDDLPPCITSPSPIASPTQELPMFEPTLFQVPVVIDDLDVYPPPIGNDPDLGVATFTWSIKQPGATSFQPLAVTSNGVALDPATYQPNDVVELRVEIHDRIVRDFSGCLPDDPTCNLNPSDATCLQRETWKVRVQ